MMPLIDKGLSSGCLIGHVRMTYIGVMALLSRKGLCDALGGLMVKYNITFIMYNAIL